MEQVMLFHRESKTYDTQLTKCGRQKLVQLISLVLLTTNQMHIKLQTHFATIFLLLAKV